VRNHTTVGAARSSAGSPLKTKIVKLVQRMAGDKPNLGYDRIQGALANLGHEISNTTSVTF
jgi:hypothetical protein